VTALLNSVQPSRFDALAKGAQKSQYWTPFCRQRIGRAFIKVDQGFPTADVCGGSQGMNVYLKWFSIVVGIGVFVNLWFAIPALFYPPPIIKILGIDPNFETLWLRDAGMLLLAGSLFHALTATAPHRYPAFAWLVVITRFFGVALWLEIFLFNVFDSTSRPDLVLPLLVLDTAFGIVQASLLYLGFRRS
jgi:hypothetical protein